MVGYKTSVIIPVYNTEQYLDECIQSVLDQTQTETEILLIDDGSTDKSYEIMCSYATQYANVKVFHQENKKLGAARNLGLEKATGKYILFLDSDDYIEKNCLKELFNCTEENHLDFVTFDSEILVEGTESNNNYPTYDRSKLGIENKVYRGWAYLNDYHKIGGVFVSACLGYYNADFLKKNLISFEEQVYYEDNEFSLKVYYHAERMMYLGKKLYVRRYRDNSIMTSSCGIVHIQSAFKMNEKCLKLLLDVSGMKDDLRGIREVISTLANRVINQLKSYKNDIELYNNPYIRDFYYLFVACDEDRLLSNLGLELAFAYCYIFSYVIENGYLKEVLDTDEVLLERLGLLKCRIRKAIDKLLDEYEIMETDDKYIIIYGTGDVADRMINCYKFIYGKSDEMRHKIIFANTKCTEEKEDFPMVQIDRIGKYPVSVILVASTKYECEMCSTLNKLYGKRFAYKTYREIANISIDR